MNIFSRGDGDNYDKYVFGGDGDDTIVGGPSSKIPTREMVLIKLNEKFNGAVYGDSYLKTTKAISLPSNSLKKSNLSNAIGKVSPDQLVSPQSLNFSRSN